MNTNFNHEDFFFRFMGKEKNSFCEFPDSGAFMLFVLSGVVTVVRNSSVLTLYKGEMVLIGEGISMINPLYDCELSLVWLSPFQNYPYTFEEILLKEEKLVSIPYLLFQKLNLHKKLLVNNVLSKTNLWLFEREVLAQTMIYYMNPEMVSVSDSSFLYKKVIN
ncbi:MAG: hypothetical protein H6Q12_225 [Bacteroidetes bacterium]|nr:hypothetical protein [Bacteroidota bacterium]